MIKSQDIKKGTCIRMDGKLYFCIDFLHVKPGKGNTIMRTTLKDVVSGRVPSYPSKYYVWRTANRYLGHRLWLERQLQTAVELHH